MPGLAFASPALLLGLLALPVIWWLLRLTPPRPTVEAFPPLRILLDLGKREETPAQSPWWLTLLRLALAALVILALAGPILNPRAAQVEGGGTLAVLMDNGWASAPDWEARVEAAGDLIEDAREAGVPIAIAFSAEGAAQNAAPSDADTALERLRAARPRPLADERATAADLLASTLADEPVGTLALLTNGIALGGTDGQAGWAAPLAALEPRTTVLFAETDAERIALVGARNTADGLVATARRADGTLPATEVLVARDPAGRVISEAPLVFEEGAREAVATIDVPFELRNDFARLDLGARNTAGSVRLLDDAFRRRRVALVSGVAGDLAQPLLSPLYYIDRALSPFADLTRPATADLGASIPALIEREPSVIVLADVGTLPEDAADAIEDWVRDGGTLLRFAGPRLANVGGTGDPLLPVRLRAGERALGGTLSWDEPQPIESFAEGSPFADLDVPEDVTIERQVLAQPSPDLASRTWASLSDGTPLVTAARLGGGTVVLYHVPAEATWSNLPLSGTFVEMLRRIVSLSAGTAGPAGAAEAGETALPPYRVLTAAGALSTATGEARPLALDDDPAPSIDTPPGLYGSREGFVALNLLDDAVIEPLASPDLPATSASYATANAVKLRPYLLLAAFALLLVDTLVMVAMAGGLTRVRRGLGQAAGALVLGLSLAAHAPSPAIAQDTDGGSTLDLTALVDETRFAFVVTGDGEIDETSERGLFGLTQFLRAKTALEPGDPVGVDLELDELNIFPLIYFPVDAGAPLPSRRAIARLDGYMKNGGTVLFDTRDQISAPPGTGFGASANMDRLRLLIGGLDIPALEPVPSDHVLTKSFYLLDRFPGRYAEGDLWVERLEREGEATTRPVRAGDGVSAVMITSNDLAGAWAIDARGLSLYPTVPNSPFQRELAYRGGVNIAMYMLTGNYKADQVHVPSLLERLGQ